MAPGPDEKNMLEKPAPTDRPILDVLARRWSPRAIDPNHPVAPPEILTLLEAARWAPSCFNEQPWRVLVFDRRQPGALDAARSTLVPGNAWAKAAPTLLLTCAKSHFTKNGKPNRTAQHDVGLAAENMALQAMELGLVFHQMAGFDVKRAKEAFHIPDDFVPMAMIAVGYPGRVEDLPPNLRQRELRLRERKPTLSWAYAGEWERSLVSPVEIPVPTPAVEQTG
jgi:nitroreductase